MRVCGRMGAGAHVGACACGRASASAGACVRMPERARTRVGVCAGRRACVCAYMCLLVFVS